VRDEAPRFGGDALIRQGVHRAEHPVEPACGQHLHDLIGVAMRLPQLQTTEDAQLWELLPAASTVVSHDHSLCT
jgi:hypothetical protein